MKKILGLDLGTNSIGWALIEEANNENEKSSIIKLGVRVNPLTTDELTNFEEGKSITTTADRTLKRSARRNLQRYKLRRENLVKILKENNFISDEVLLSENGNKSTFETYNARARAASEIIELDQFARVLLMINKKRGYKSSRKVKNNEEGQLIDGMEVAKKLYNDNITPGELVLQIVNAGKKYKPDFYRSDLQAEFDRIWEFQKQFYPEILTDDFKTQISGKGKQITSKIFLAKHGIYTADNRGTDKKTEACQWRVDALNKQITKEVLAFVTSDINGNISATSGYLGDISDRSKELYFNKLTVGQYQMAQLKANPNASLKKQVFYRQDYLDEFNTIWERQALYHNKLTPELKAEIRDIVIFYQRRLKSQKGLISFCEFESKQIEVEIDGKKKYKRVGSKVCPWSSPIYQEFIIWQTLNNLELSNKNSRGKRLLTHDEKELLFNELSLKSKLSKEAALKLLFENYKEFDFNFKEIKGNATQAALFEAYRKIIELSGHGDHDFSKTPSSEILTLVKNIFEGLNYSTEILTFNSSLEGKEFEKQALYRLWHLLYSFEGDDSNTGNEKLINKISSLVGFEREYAAIIANVAMPGDYGSLSFKAVRKILPFLKEGNEYSVACGYAGYRHSKSSLTKPEIENKVLKERLDILPKNSLRNPVVEKILNQMINLINTLVDTYGKPDEIRVELARELKKSAKEREELTTAIAKTTKEHERYRAILQNDFGIKHVSRNDIIRYKLYLELANRGYKTLYSNTFISQHKLFSKEFDVEHIIPQSRMFDDSFSNKTLETRGVNIEKGNDTALDYVSAKYGQAGLTDYLKSIEELYKNKIISKAKFLKLKMKGDEIPADFINRDLADTRYIAKRAKAILEDMVREVVTTTGSITNRLREDWQLIDVMRELNWDKYHKLGLTEIIENRDGHKIKRITEWTKRNDHRHHAMDALTVAFTKRSYIQYLNNLNARGEKGGSINSIETKELYRDDRGKMTFKPPIPLEQFRAEAKEHLENILVSIKAKNKVTTTNINTIDKPGNERFKKRQLTPRGQLHLETVYGSIKQYISKEEKVGASFDEKQIAKVAKASYRKALLNRLTENGNDPEKAFTGKNSLAKNPLYIDNLKTRKVPAKVKIVDTETVYTIRKDISPALKLDKIVDAKIKALLQVRLDQNNDDYRKAFSDIEQNPVWLNEEKGISVKRVTITGISNAIALHDKKDKEGKLIPDKDGKPQPVDFVNTGNNHHVAIYRDENGHLQEKIVSFFEATVRKNNQLPVIDKDYRKHDGWEFLFTMKQNEYFVFPDEKTGFNPLETDLLNPGNYALISPNLFRVQKISSKDYVFRNHLETTVDGNNLLKGLTWLRLGLNGIDKIVKLRVNHIGQIVSVGEY